MSNNEKVVTADDIIGIDPGFSDIKYATSLTDFNKFVTAIAEVRGHHTTTGNDIYELNGRYYYVGEKAAKQPKELILDLSRYEDLEMFLPLLIVHVFNQVGKDFKKICMGLSPSHILNIDSFRKRASHFVVNGKEYNLDVKIIPQGMGATLALFQLNNLYDSDFLLVDGGFNTIDVIFGYQGEIQTQLINGDNAFENKGVIGVANKLIELVKNKYNITLGIRDAQQCLNTRRLKHRGNVIDLEEDVDDCIHRYTKELMDFLQSRYGGDMDKMDAVYIVGGLSYLVDPKIEGYAEGFIKVFDDSEYLNAIGNYLKVLSEVKN
jgi:mreB-like ATPase involved in cell division